MRHGMLPPTLHVDEPSPHVDWSAGDGAAADRGRCRGRETGRPRRAGVSSFGVSGTNAHVIVEEAPAAGDQAPAGQRGPGRRRRRGAGRRPARGAWRAWRRGWCRGGSGDAVRAQAGRLAEFVAEPIPALGPADVGWSLATTRAVFEHRAVVTGTGREELLAGLAALRGGRPPTGGWSPGRARGGGRAVFVFPGQGAQWAGMGAGAAARSSPVFAQAMRPVRARRWRRHLGWDAGRGRSATGAARWSGWKCVQPALWAVMVALAGLWQALGVVPDGGGGALAGRDRGGVRGRGAVAGGRGPGGGAARPGDAEALAGPGGDGRRWPCPRAAGAGAGPAWPGRVVGRGGQRPGRRWWSPASPARWRSCWRVRRPRGSRARRVRGGLRLALRAGGAGAGRARWRRWSRSAPGPRRSRWYSTVTGRAGRTGGLGRRVLVREPARARSGSQTRSPRCRWRPGTGRSSRSAPHPVLIRWRWPDDRGRRRATAPRRPGTLRRDEGGAGRVLDALAGRTWPGPARTGKRSSPPWARAPAGGGAGRELPTYAFQRQRYWPRAAGPPGGRGGGWAGGGRSPAAGRGGRAGRARGGGVHRPAVAGARTRGWPTTRSPGMVLVPGTACVELAVRAGDQAGLRPGRGADPGGAAGAARATAASRSRSSSGDPDGAGQRAVAVYARPEQAAAGPARRGAPWTGHATRRAGARAAAAPCRGGAGCWRERGRRRARSRLDLDGVYERLAGAGAGLRAGVPGPGARRGGRRGGPRRGRAARRAERGAGGVVRPAPGPARRRPARAPSLTGPQEGAGRLPFAFAGVSLHAAGARALRVRLTADRRGTLSRGGR